MDQITNFDRMRRVRAIDIVNVGHAPFLNVDGASEAIDIDTLAVAYAGMTPVDAAWNTVRFELVSRDFGALLDYEVAAGTDPSSADWLLAFAIEKPGWYPCALNPAGEVTFPLPFHFSYAGDWPLHHLLRVMRAENDSSREFALPMPEVSRATPAWNELFNICPGADDPDVGYLVLRATLFDGPAPYALTDTLAETWQYPLSTWTRTEFVA